MKVHVYWADHAVASYEYFRNRLKFEPYFSERLHFGAVIRVNSYDGHGLSQHLRFSFFLLLLSPSECSVFAQLLEFEQDSLGAAAGPAAAVSDADNK